MSGRTPRPDPLPIAPLTGRLDAVVTVPGSKSATNRALTVAALAGGRSRLVGALLSDDTEAMIDSLGRAGWSVLVADDGTTVDVDGRPAPPEAGEVCDADAVGGGVAAAEQEVVAVLDLQMPAAADVAGLQAVVDVGAVAAEQQHGSGAQGNRQQRGE